MKRGLNRQIIVTEAIRMVEEQGYDRLSVRELASRLGIKPASLYNHIDGIEDLSVSIAEEVGERLEHELVCASAGKGAEDAIRGAARAYLAFATEHYQLYRALIRVPKADTERHRTVGAKSFACFMKILHGYGLDPEVELNLVRMLRSFLHGFVELCESGYMTHSYGDRRDSFDFALEEFIGLLRAFDQGEKGEVILER